MKIVIPTIFYRKGITIFINQIYQDKREEKDKENEPKQCRAREGSTDFDTVAFLLSQAYRVLYVSVDCGVTLIYSLRMAYEQYQIIWVV